MLQIIPRGTNGVNYWQGRAGYLPLAIVNHCMGRDKAGNLATIEGTLSWFRNPASEVSAHFGIARDGRVWQFVSLGDTAWANGIVELPDQNIKWLIDAVSKKVNPNYLTVSIEHEGDGILPMPEIQYQASLSLHKFISAECAIVLDKFHIIRHSQITGISRANCPGISFPMTRLLADLQGGNKMDNVFKDELTGYTVYEPFATFYKLNGGLQIFGRPISPGIVWPTGYPGVSKIQWFERARFELHGTNTIMLGLVGTELFDPTK